jgi:NAD(P)H-flavin reductase
MLTVDHADESWRGGVGVVTTVLERLSLRSPADTMLMTCGPEVMMWYTIQTALGRGIPAGSLFLSMERNMNCAIALCGHCQFGPYFLCREGPVFHFEKLRSILRIDDL